jgi:DUF4097 and DUF4098 domain-containing protein YvlB
VVITVPRDSSVQLDATRGPVTVEGVQGDIQTESTHGSLRLTGISGAVLVSTTHGSINVSMDRVNPSQAMALATDKGDIDVTLPDGVKLDVQMDSVGGPMYTDFEIIGTGAPLFAERAPLDGGPLRIRFDKMIYGTINGGGAKVSFRTVNGSIKLRKKGGTRNP